MVWSVPPDAPPPRFKTATFEALPLSFNFTASVGVRNWPFPLMVMVVVWLPDQLADRPSMPLSVPTAEPPPAIWTMPPEILTTLASPDPPRFGRK